MAGSIYVLNLKLNAVRQRASVLENRVITLQPRKKTSAGFFETGVFPSRHKIIGGKGGSFGV